MVTVHNTGAYLLGGNDWIPDGADAAAIVRRRPAASRTGPRRGGRRWPTASCRAQHRAGYGQAAHPVRRARFARHHLCRHHPDARERAYGVSHPLRAHQLPTIPCARWAAPSMRTTICSGSRPPQQVRRDLRAAAPPAVIHQYMRERMSGCREDDPRPGQPHPLRRASAPWPSARAARSLSSSCCAAPMTSTCRKSSACT